MTPWPGRQAELRLRTDGEHMASRALLVVVSDGKAAAPGLRGRCRERAAGLSERRVADRTLGSERVRACDEPTVSIEHCADAAAGGIAFGVAARHRPVDVDDDRPIAVFDPHRAIVDCSESRS
jgi:hypothetical protein